MQQREKVRADAAALLGCAAIKRGLRDGGSVRDTDDARRWGTGHIDPVDSSTPRIIGTTE